MLAALLYQAAEEGGYLDPDVVEEVLRVTAEEARESVQALRNPRASVGEFTHRYNARCQQQKKRSLST